MQTIFIMNTTDPIHIFYRKLEFQLQTQRLSLKEEKHLVATIDAMKRSKKTLK